MFRSFTVIDFSLNYSKMAVEKVQSLGKICILDVEVKGVQNIKETDLNARFLFVQPPDIDALVSCDSK